MELDKKKKGAKIPHQSANLTGVFFGVSYVANTLLTYLRARCTFLAIATMLCALLRLPNPESRITAPQFCPTAGTTE